MPINKYDYPSSGNRFLINAEANIRKKSMQKSISEMLQEVDEAKTKKQKIELIRKYYSPSMGNILQSIFDPGVVWMLPEGEIPYTPTEYLDVEGRLIQEAKKLYLFVKGGQDNLTDKKRCDLFIQVLESVTPDDAKLLMAAKDKKMPYKSITAKLVNEAFGTSFPS